MRTPIHEALSLLSMLAKLAVLLLRGLFLLLFWLIGAAQRHHATMEGRVRVVDGDSLSVVQNGRTINIRLFGIDAPEASQPEGPASTRALRAIIRHQPVTIRPKKKDRYGRTVAQVFLPDGTDVAHEMVRRGMALADSRYSKAYCGAEAIARRAHAGFWAQGGIVHPSAWRARRAA